jgi:HSP20 family protein
MNGVSPFGQEVVGLRQAMDQLLSDSFVPGPYRTVWSRGGGGTPNSQLPLDVYATQDAFVIVAAVPGLRPEDLEVTYDRGTVVLGGAIGNVAETEESAGATWYLRELWHGRFQRAVTPPFEVDPSQAEASFENGILRIRLPKAEHAKPQRIPVRAGGATQAIGAGS